jgi:hypothetical protein
MTLLTPTLGKTHDFATLTRLFNKDLTQIKAIGFKGTSNNIHLRRFVLG